MFLIYERRIEGISLAHRPLKITHKSKFYSLFYLEIFLIEFLHLIEIWLRYRDQTIFGLNWIYLSVGEYCKNIKSKHVSKLENFIAIIKLHVLTQEDQRDLSLVDADTTYKDD